MGLLDDAEKRYDEAEAQKAAAALARKEQAQREGEQVAALWAEFIQRARSIGLDPTRKIERVVYRGFWEYRYRESDPRSATRRLSAHAYPEGWPEQKEELSREVVALAFVLTTPGDYEPILVTEDCRVLVRIRYRNERPEPDEPGQVEGRVIEEPVFTVLETNLVFESRAWEISGPRREPLADVLVRALREHA